MICEETSGAATPEAEPAKKRHLIGLSGKQKRAICLYKEQNPRFIHTEISDYFTMVWKFKVPLSTVSYILKTKNRWLDQSTAKNYIRLKKHQYEKLHTVLYAWFKETQSRGEQVTDNMLVEQGKRIGHELGIVHFPYSPRWLRGFKASHGLSNNPVNAQYCTVVESDGGGLSDRWCGFAYEEIYSFVELHLACSEASTPGDASQVIQVFLCTNTIGTDKLQPFAVGRHAAPLDGGEADRARYVSVKGASQLDDIIKNWLQNVSLQMHLNGRHILLLFHTDRCCRYDAYPNVETLFLPPSDKPHAVLDLADTFKAHYDDLLERFQTVDGELGVTLVDALRLVKVSWDSLSRDAITECWNSTRFHKRPTDGIETVEPISEDSSSRTGDTHPSPSVEQVRTAFAVALGYFRQDTGHKSTPHLGHLTDAQRDMETVVSELSLQDFKSLFASCKD